MCSSTHRRLERFSALQRAEIAEIASTPTVGTSWRTVSVLFNEPKLLKCWYIIPKHQNEQRFSALQRAEIAEIQNRAAHL